MSWRWDGDRLVGPGPDLHATAVPRQAAVPESRLSRSLHLGRLARGGVKP